jgi:hypothetical protein
MLDREPSAQRPWRRRRSRTGDVDRALPVGRVRGAGCGLGADDLVSGFPLSVVIPLIAGLGTGLSVLGAEGVGYPPVDGISLPGIARTFLTYLLDDLDERFARAEQYVLGCSAGGRAGSVPALLARLATRVNSLDPVATACDAIVDIGSRLKRLR